MLYEGAGVPGTRKSGAEAGGAACRATVDELGALFKIVILSCMCPTLMCESVIVQEIVQTWQAQAKPASRGGRGCTPVGYA